MLQKGIRARVYDPRGMVTDIHTLMRGNSEGDMGLIGGSYVQVMLDRVNVRFVVDCNDFRHEPSVPIPKYAQLRKAYHLFLGTPKYPMADKPIDVTLVIGLAEKVFPEDQVPFGNPIAHIISIGLRHSSNALGAASYLSRRDAKPTIDGETFLLTDIPYGISIDPFDTGKSIEARLTVSDQYLMALGPEKSAELIGLARSLSQNIEYTISSMRGNVIH